jgi:AcrR family transcriptional regulator
METSSASSQHGEGTEDNPIRRRILDAAFSAFMERGYAETSTLEIATRAHVSKRELYAVVGNKQEMLAACISERAKRLHVPADLPVPRDRETLARTLVGFGALLLREVSDPTVIGVFRLAIAEAARAPEVARALDSLGRDASRTALREILAQATMDGLLIGQPVELAEQFAGLLWGDLMVSLLLRVADRPTPQETMRRARGATDAFLQLHPQPDNAAIPPGHEPA